MRAQLPRGSFSGQSTNVNAQVLENFFPEFDAEQGKSVLSLYGTPGLGTALVTPVANVPVRALYPFGDLLYAVCGSKLYSITTAWAATLRGTIGTSTGHVDIDDDGTQLGICDGSLSYYYHPGSGTFAATPGLFTIDSSLTEMGGYFIYTEGTDYRMQNSNLVDPTTRGALEITSVRRSGDKLVRALAARGELLAFKENNIDIYYQTTEAAISGGFPFETSPGAFIDVGLIARGALCKWDGVPYWINDNRELIRMVGHETQKLSTPQIDYQFGKFTTLSDIILFSCEIQGHIWIVINWPTEGKTYVYDVSMSELSGMHTWFNLTSYNTTELVDTRHRSNCYAFFNNTHVIGDYETGALHEWDMDTYTDAGTRIRRRALFPALHDTENRSQIIDHLFEIEFEPGVGLVTGQGSDPTAVLDWSNDGAHSFENEVWRSVGKQGARGTLARWRGPGGPYRQRNYRLTVSDPVKWVVIGATHDPERLSA